MAFKKAIKLSPKQTVQTTHLSITAYSPAPVFSACVHLQEGNDKSDRPTDAALDEPKWNTFSVFLSLFLKSFQADLKVVEREYFSRSP